MDNAPLQVFIGYDPRQPVAFTACAHSILRHSSVPVSITALHLKQLPIKRRGLTEFTYSRFLVPWLCEFKGRAVFMDADIVVVGDIAEMFAVGDMSAVCVNQEQERFEWPSVMLFNNSACRRLTPEFIEDPKNRLFDFEWAPYVGKLPKVWNQIIGYGPSDPHAKLLHYTRGVPVWPETQGEVEDGIWFDELERANYTCDYASLMGQSIHAERPKA
jgi:hypothetical protein